MLLAARGLKKLDEPAPPFAIDGENRPAPDED